MQGVSPPQGDADLMGGGAGRMLGTEGVLCTVRKCLSLVSKVLSLQFDVETNEIRYRHRVKARLALAWGHRQGVSLQFASSSAYTPQHPRCPHPRVPPASWLLESLHSKPGARG